MLLTTRQRTLPRAHLRTGETDIPGPYSHGSSGYPPPASWAGAGSMGATLLNAPMAMEGTTSYDAIEMGRSRNAAIRYAPPTTVYGDELDPNMGRTRRRNAGDDAAATTSPWKFGVAGLLLGGVAGFLLAKELK